jgi:hypothetical protein
MLVRKDLSGGVTEHLRRPHHEEQGMEEAKHSAPTYQRQARVQLQIRSLQILHGLSYKTLQWQKHTTKSAIAGENTETQSSHTKISGNSIRKDAASPLTAADRELIRETYMVQDNQNPPDADSIAEQHSLDSGHDFVDKKDQQHASERQRGGSETNFERNEEKGESLDDNAELAADNKTACLPVRFTNDGKDERTPCLGQNNQPSVDGNEPGSRHRSATPSPRQTPPVHAPHD